MCRPYAIFIEIKVKVWSTFTFLHLLLFMPQIPQNEYHIYTLLLEKEFMISIPHFRNCIKHLLDFSDDWLQCGADMSRVDSGTSRLNYIVSGGKAELGSREHMKTPYEHLLNPHKSCPCSQVNPSVDITPWAYSIINLYQMNVLLPLWT